MSKTKYVRVKLTENELRAILAAGRMVLLIGEHKDLDYSCATYSAARELMEARDSGGRARYLKSAVGKLQLEVRSD